MRTGSNVIEALVVKHQVVALDKWVQVSPITPNAWYALWRESLGIVNDGSILKQCYAGRQDGPFAEPLTQFSCLEEIMDGQKRVGP